MSSSTSSQFLRLVPANSEAKRAYNDIAAKIKSEPSSTKFVHASQYMFIEPCPQDRVDAHGLTEVHEVRASIDLGNSVTDVESDVDVEEQPELLLYRGYYFLSFDIPPGFPLIGWVVGLGRWDAKGSKPNGGVELQLAVPGTPSSKYELAGRHARIFFDISGSIMLGTVSDRSPRIMLNTEEYHSGQRLVADSKCIVFFGKLAYTLEYVINDEEEYQRRLRQYFRNFLHLAAPPPDLSATPSPWDFRLGDWLVRGTVGKGSYATVSAAKHTVTGETGAAKLLVRTRQTHVAIATEIRLLQSLPMHPQILRFRAVQYERENRWYSGPSDEDDERYTFQARPERVAIFYTPFARATVSELFNEIPMRLRLIAFFQLLQGVCALHSDGFIHRDIKPANWGVVEFSMTDISTVILDYGHATRATACEPKKGSVGTIAYLAPEMEVTTYGREVDIWACGIIGRQLFKTDGKIQWQNVTQDQRDYKSAMVGLQAEPKMEVGNLLSHLLAWNPEERISAANALKHACFSDMPQHKQQKALPRTGQKHDRS